MKIDFRILQVASEAKVTLKGETVEKTQKRVEAMLEAGKLSFHKPENAYVIMPVKAVSRKV